MRSTIFSLAFIFTFLFVFPHNSYAVYDPSESLNVAEYYSNDIKINRSDRPNYVLHTANVLMKKQLEKSSLIQKIQKEKAQKNTSFFQRISLWFRSILK